MPLVIIRPFAGRRLAGRFRSRSYNAMKYVSALLFALSTASLVVGEDKPNILIILSDDQGYCDLGSTLDIATADNLGAPLAAKYRAIQACTDNEAPIAVCFEAARKCSPNLDALARQGVRFTQFYSAPTCSPARAALMTGRYPQSFGVYTNTDVVVDDKGVPPAVKFPVKVFQNAGYMTGIVGKWHLGSRQAGQHPNDRGFDYYFGFDIAVTQKYNSKRLYRNRETTQAVGWLADQTSAEAVAFLDRSQQEQRPFFLYVAYNEPHGPTERPPQPYIDHFKSGSDVVDVHFGTIYGMDHGIGRILDELKRTGRMANTLIVFCSDHGDQLFEHGITDKNCFFEASVRVPFMVSLPGRIQPARYDQLIETVDLLPTLFEFIGLPEPRECQGRSFAPLIANLGRAYEPHDAVFSENIIPEVITGGKLNMPFEKGKGVGGTRHPDAKMVRTERWKYCYYPDGYAELYDVPNDPQERTNLAGRAEFHTVEDDLRTRLLNWLINSSETDQIAPRWLIPENEKVQRRELQ